MSATKEEILKLSNLGKAEVMLDKVATDMKEVVLKDAKAVDKIENTFEAELAADSLRAIKELISSVENARKAVKAPVLKITRQIDGVAKDFSEDLLEHKTRISRLLGSFQAMERERQERARLDALEKEKLARLEMEKAAQAAKTDEEFDKVREEGINKVADARNELANTKRNEPKGVQLRESFQWEVTDINELYKARRELVKLEPNADAIRATIKFTQDIPGLRVWKEAKAVV